MRISAVGEGQGVAGRRRAIRAAGAAPRRKAALIALVLALPGCGAVDSVGNAFNAAVGGTPAIQPGQQGFVQGFLGGVAAEEPRAALVARNVLSAGGTASDAAVAAGFTLTVTLPSRAGLGGGGACVMYSPRRNEAETIVFLPGGREAVPPGADRPAAVPMLARGLFALHSRGGRRPFEELLVPAEQSARLGTEVSRAFATDLAAVAGPLFADPWAAATFGGPGGQPLATGDRLVQAELGGTLALLRTAGVGDLYQGGLARRMEEASVPAGGGLTVGELRASVPQLLPPLQLRVGNDTASFLPPPEAGGIATAGALQALGAGAPPPAAAARGISVARAWRERGGDPLPLLSAEIAADGPWPVLPASTGLTVLDREGNAVTCAFTMNNLFGTGRVAPGTGVLLAAAPGIGQVTPPLLAAGIIHNGTVRAFKAAAAGSGQHMAPLAAATALAAGLRGQEAGPALASVPEPGRAVAVTCPRYLPGQPELCQAAVDPRGAGLALGATAR